MSADPVSTDVLPIDPAHDPHLKPSGITHTVVGIGASAGGMQALTRFFENVPVRCGMSFVVVMHLSPAHESHVAAILQRVTAMPVNEVTETVPIQVDHVYVIPPGWALGMNDGALTLREAPRVGGRNVAIDIFFRLLAHVHRQHAVSIVLSGTGTDGSLGLTRIKELGGVTIVQAPSEAEHDGMPSAAIATGMVDFVLPVADMPATLVRLATNASAIRLPADVAASLQARAPASAEEEARAETALVEIMAALRDSTQHDFSHYKRPTVLRRLERRMQVTAVPDLEAYRDHLLSHPEEAPALLQDMLISVTNFFRDREAFDALERAVLPLMHGLASSGRGLRAWVVGCATGEEAYSLAMLLHEARERVPQAPPFQVFASDIDERALGQARSGLYPDAIASDVVHLRLRNFFFREGNHYRVVKSLRERVLFAQHNVLRDAPFSRVDIVCCRNLLIYLDRGAQAAALETFRFALQPGGLLFLGSSESAEVAGDHYTVVDKRHRLYRVNPGATAHRLPGLAVHHRFASGGLLRLPTVPQERHRPFAELHRRALLQVAPPSVLVDAQHNILHMAAGVARFLQLQDGVPSHHLLDNLNPSARAELRSALFRARPREQLETGETVSVVLESHDGRARVTVRPLARSDAIGTGAGTGDSPAAFLVSFEPLPGAQAPGAPATEMQATAPGGDSQRHVAEIESDNRRLELQLQAVIEHTETSTQDLMSSNEELQAVNEELRSATEELETSREELQSTNEELITVNSQLALKVEEAGRINDDLQNLINANDIATVFVDRAMRIKRYTPRATELFNLIPSDVERSLLDITNRLDYPELVEDATTAFQTLRLVEREVRGFDDRRFVARLLPYRTLEDRIEGAVLSFVDVTVLRKSQEEARFGTERLRLAAESTRDFAILTADERGIVSSWNQGAQRLFGYPEHEIVGQPLALIFTDEDRAAGVPERELQQTLQQGRAEDERWHRRKDGSVFFCSGVTTRLEDGRGFGKITRDLTGSQHAAMARERLLSREQAGRRLAEATMEAKELFLAVMSHELKHPLNLIHINAELLARMPEIRHVPAAGRAADIIRQTVAGQARIIDDLLDLSRARTGKLRLEREPVDWGVVVGRIVEAARPDALDKGVHLQFEPAPAALVSQFDPVRAEQVVWNLLSNAVKFTPEGGSIRVLLADEGDCVRLSVTDSGRGIDPAFVDSVWDMFSQERGPSRRQEEGLGIGLALVRELVVAHDGRVQARSEGLGRGAEFSIWVPLARSGAGAGDGADAPSVLHGLRLLLVDDSADSVESFAMLLRLVGATVTTCATGQEVLQTLEHERFDALISDVSMPGMGGLELIQAVRAQPFGRGLVALACSGYSRAQDERRAIDAGFDALIPKPAALEQVERVVARLRAARPAGETRAS